MQQLDKKIRVTRFFALYTLSLLLLIFIFSAYVRPSPRVIYKKVKEPAVMVYDNSLSVGENKLKVEFIKLQKIDQDYLAAMSNPTQKAASDAFAKDKATMEQGLSRILDSMTSNTSTRSKDGIAQLEHTLEFYREILATSKNVIAPSNPVSAINNSQKDQADSLKKQLARKNQEIAQLSILNNSKANESQLQKLKNEIAIKNMQIANLQKQGVAIQPRKVAVEDPKMVSELQTRNKNLSAGFNSMMTQLGVMTKKYNLLKNENTSLISQVSDLRRTTKDK